MKKKNLHKGIAWKFITCLLMAFENNIIKYIFNKTNQKKQDIYLIHVIILFQNIFSLIIILPLIINNPKKFIKIKFPILNLIRIISTIVGINLWYMFIQQTTITQAISISFINPILMIYFSIIILKEKTNTKKNISMILSIIGLMIIIKPYNIHIKEINIIYPIISNICITLSKIISKKLINLKENKSALIFYLILTNFITFLIISKKKNIIIIKKDITYMIILGIINILINYSIIQTYKLTQIISLIPFGIPFKIITNFILSYIFLNEKIKIFPIIIGTIIIAISLSLLTKENAKKQRNKK